MTLTAPPGGYFTAASVTRAVIKIDFQSPSHVGKNKGQASSAVDPGIRRLPAEATFHSIYCLAKEGRCLSPLFLLILHKAVPGKAAAATFNKEIINQKRCSYGKIHPLAFSAHSNQNRNDWVKVHFFIGKMTQIVVCLIRVYFGVKPMTGKLTKARKGWRYLIA